MRIEDIDIDLDELLKDAEPYDETERPEERLMSEERQRLMFLAHDFSELDEYHMNCDICYCSSYCKSVPHLQCRETRYDYLSKHIIDHREAF